MLCVVLGILPLIEPLGMLGGLPFGGTALLELEDCALFVSDELLGGASSWFEVTFVFDLDRYIVAAVNASNPVKVTAAMIFFVFLYISFISYL